MIRPQEQRLYRKLLSAPGFVSFCFRVVDSKAPARASFSPLFPSASHAVREARGAAGGAPRSTINEWTHHGWFRRGIAASKRPADPPAVNNPSAQNGAARGGSASAFPIHAARR